MREFTDEIVNKFKKNVHECPYTGCWIWKGIKNEHGHGVFIVGSISYGPADKVSWDMFLKIPNPANRSPYRTCYNHKCLNPEHFKSAIAKPLAVVKDRTIEDYREENRQSEIKRKG